MNTEQELTPLILGAQQMNIPLTPSQIAAFARYCSELEAWNQRMNLTAIEGCEQIQIRHFLDSLSCLPTIQSRFPTHRNTPLRMIDVGTGAGFPGIPLKITQPSIHLTLLEATKKKIQFLEHLIALLQLENTKVVHARAEEIGHAEDHRETYDLVIARAVAPLPVLVEYMLPLCRVGGLSIAQKGPAAYEEAQQATDAITILGGQLAQIIPVEVPRLAEERNLIVIEKIAPTPPQYPRRPGIPAKRPLGLSRRK